MLKHLVLNAFCLKAIRNESLFRPHKPVLWQLFSKCLQYFRMKKNCNVSLKNTVGLSFCDTCKEHFSNSCIWIRGKAPNLTGSIKWCVKIQHAVDYIFYSFYITKP